MKIHANCPGHMTKPAVITIYSKCLLNIHLCNLRVYAIGTWYEVHVFGDARPAKCIQMMSLC